MDLFKLLGGGAQFDKKRFSHDVQLFEVNCLYFMVSRGYFNLLKSYFPFQGPAKNGSTKNSAATDADKRSQLLSEIDILNDSPQKKQQPKQQTSNNKVQNDQDESGTIAQGESVTIETPEQANVFRKSKRIRVYGTDIPNPFSTFEDLTTYHDLKPLLYKNIKQSKYTSPTPIQMQSIPIILHGRDLMACAPTGSGKTLAYLLPILQDLDKPSKVGYRALIIAPTRELAQQIDRELSIIGASTNLKVNVLTKATAAHKAQNPQQRQKFDVLISTPLRLVHAVREKEIDLRNVRHLVLDEADKLLELGFLEQTDEIFAACSSTTIRKSLFSATFSSTVEELAQSVMKNPIRVVVGARNAATDTIKQELIFTGNEAGKMVALRQYIQKGIRPPVLIFVQSIDRAKELFRELVFDGINVEVIHSDRTKAQRDSIINQFRLGRIWVLIATELMARGLDFKGVNLVINYDFPQSVASYIHRIGRTGRAGRAGEAVTYYTKDDLQYLKSVVNVMRESGCDVPEWMLNLKKPNHNQRKDIRKGIERETIDSTPKRDRNAAAKKKEMIEASKKRKKQQKQQEKNKKNKTKQSSSSETTPSSPAS
ncbi:P-loop containing nucleoside triphosphate hydrolase protein [Zychaea mexicana]|uniref:P-loop containing nucleoside triphosphate hydrolase protein n=1 Tax=Zychaea mexicana TaxID=64656 RepID=UPI0022FE8488|nr:P-loop containing nucleoside triphosphate hydrolase protein [Zychaea mexicana]KAI9493613.1 P-loop containing nucleoside triphosphate hydrolase protein [Zychaea mexicana]